MKILFILMMLSFSITSFAQQGSNRFDEQSAKEVEISSQQNEEEYNPIPNNDVNGPGNPGLDPVPIDNYLPMLITTALGIIIYTTQKKKKLLS